jgi:ubiquinone/menaquinone biosynthesis C-methylase UbiE
MSWLMFWRRRDEPGAVSPHHMAHGGLVAPDRVPFSLPKNIRETYRLDQQHYFLRRDLPGNHAAPLSRPGAILDIGCGTGRWAMELAAEFPHARVVGMDIVMPQPHKSLGFGLDSIPANASFIEGDATHPLPFPDASFDFVHLRMMYPAIPAPVWPSLLREAARVLRPGGWVESVEALPFPKREREGMATIILWFTELLRERGADPLAALKIAGWLRDCGLTHVESRELSHTAPTPEVLEHDKESAYGLIDDMRAAVLAADIATPQQYDQVATRARLEIQHSAQVGGFNTYVLYGQRANG